eukprot:CAMPEP_0201740222 /NCGR_PEP_ID=MMETSP0593-20130828/46192_1 /ASSEMBLY_ACC=CAM_ASM_000672 /TAXON_ID=267983 /ORGANISM="Skeletonema japonicum, Strain CCMP2506" /LENGTH=394 /DNA_ID=CAMNT_0048234527 /DNA_START=42 /DNA_END=1226 /DNA_ORIENTATION=-
MNVAVHDETTHASETVAISPVRDTLKEEKEDCDDESFESLLQRAKHTLQLLRIAQQNEKMQLQQQRQHVEGKPSPTAPSPRPNPTVDISSMGENVTSETQQQLLYRQREESVGELKLEKMELQMEETKTNHPIEEVTASTPSPKSLQENQRTAMDIFLSSPTAVNWFELVESMRQDRVASESERPRYSSSRRDLMNLIETITVYKEMDGLNDDDHSSITMSLPSETPQTSQSQQSLEDNQRSAMESFLSSPTGLHWDDFVNSLGKDQDDDRGSTTTKDRKQTMPTQNTSGDVKPSLLSTKWKLRKFQQHNHNQSSPSRDRSKKSKGARSLERRIEQILTSSPTAAVADTTYKAAGNVGSEMILNDLTAGNVESKMILHDLMTINEDIALTPKRY